MSEKVFKKINSLLGKGEKLVVATIIRAEGSTPRGIGAKMVVLEDGTTFGIIGGDVAEAEVKDKALESLKKGESQVVEMKLEEKGEGGVGMKCGGEIEVFVETLHPAPKLILIGSGRVANEVAKLAQSVGFKLVVVDPYTEDHDFPESASVIPKKVKEGLSEVEVTSESYIAIITQHRYDEPALTESLKTNAAYIGMMGSTNRVSSIFEKLEKEKNISRSKLSEIYSPIGLDIGSETPEELAVSIVGELIKERRKPDSSGKSLRKTT